VRVAVAFAAAVVAVADHIAEALLHRLEQEHQTIHHRLGLERQRVLLQQELALQTIHLLLELLQRVLLQQEPVQVIQSPHHHQTIHHQLEQERQRALLLDSALELPQTNRRLRVPALQSRPQRVPALQSRQCHQNHHQQQLE
jgi:hypothetical protein